MMMIKRIVLFAWLLSFFDFAIATSRARAGKPAAASQELAHLDQHIEKMQRFVNKHPKDATGWANLGIGFQTRDQIFHQGGLLQPKALSAFQTALDLDPRMPQAYEIHLRLGVLQKMMGLVKDAVRTYNRGLLLPNTLITTEQKAALLEQKGVSLNVLGEHEEAIAALRESLRLNPLQVSAYRPMVDALLQSDHFSTHDVETLLLDDAFADQFASSRPSTSRRGSGSASVTVLQHSWNALRVQAQYYTRLANLVSELKANNTLLALLGTTDNSPNNRALGAITSVQSSVEAIDGLTTDELISLLRSLLADHGLQVESMERVLWQTIITDAHLAMSSMYETQALLHEAGGNAPLANSAQLKQLMWKSVQAANDVERSRKARFDIVAAKNSVEQLLAVFKVGFWPKGIGHKSSVPLFIIGFMRCGSSLLEYVLDAHSEIVGTGEDSIFNGVLPDIRDAIIEATVLPDSVDVTQQIVEKYGNTIVQLMKSKASRTESQPTDDMSRNTIAAIFGNSLPKLSDNAMAEASPNKYIIDKMLFNFRNVGFIHLVFPHSTVIHVVRDPMDVVWSAHQQKYDDVGLEWNMDLEHIAHEYVNYLRLMAHWRTVLPNRVVEIRYEDLVTDYSATVKDIITNKLKLRWEPEILDFPRKGQSNSNNIVHPKFKVHKGRIGTWRRYASELKPTILLLRKLLAPMRRLNQLPFPQEINWSIDVEFEGYEPLVNPYLVQNVRENIPKWYPRAQFDGIGYRFRSTADFSDVRVQQKSKCEESVDDCNTKAIEIGSAVISQPKIKKLQ